MDPIDNIQKSYSVSSILDDLPLDNLNMTYQPLSINFNEALLNSWKNLNKVQKPIKPVSYPFFKNVNFEKKSLALNDCFMFDKDEENNDDNDNDGDTSSSSNDNDKKFDSENESSEEEDVSPFGKRKESYKTKLVHFNNYYGWKKRRIERVELKGDGEQMMGRGVRINDFFM